MRIALCNADYQAQVRKNHFALCPNIPPLYTQWHTWGDVEKKEWMSNAHEQGGNLIFCDGHAAYSKYVKLTSLDFGLLDLQGKVVPWIASETSSRQEHKPAF